MQELIQNNSKNWRKFTLQSSGILAESHINGDTLSRKLPFDRIGSITQDYAYATTREYRYPPIVRQSIFVVAIIVTVVCFAIGNAMQQHSAGHVSASTATFFVLGWGSLLASILATWLHTKKVRTKRVFFESGGHITFYARNAQDADQIEFFLKEFETMELAYRKENFLDSV